MEKTEQEKLAQMINQPDLLDNLAEDFDIEFSELTEEEIEAIELDVDMFGEEAESNLDGRGDN